MEGSARNGGVMEGDMLRACTAVKMAMSYPTWNLLLGGVGKPQLQKVPRIPRLALALALDCSPRPRPRPRPWPHAHPPRTIAACGMTIQVLFPTDGESFETVMAALGSNSEAQQGNGQVILFLERARASRAEPQEQS